MLTLYRTPGIAKLGEGCLDEINTFIVIDGFDELVPLSGKRDFAEVRTFFASSAMVIHLISNVLL